MHLLCTVGKKLFFVSLDIFGIKIWLEKSVNYNMFESAVQKCISPVQCTVLVELLTLLTCVSLVQCILLVQLLYPVNVELLTPSQNTGALSAARRECLSSPLLPYCSVMYSKQYCIVQFTAPKCKVNSTVSYCTRLYITMDCTGLAVQSSILYSTVQCTVQYSTVYCTVH